MLQKRLPTCALFSNWCVLCRKEEETRDHMLMHCPFTCIWFKTPEELGLMWVVPRSTRKLFVLDIGLDIGKRGSIFWSVRVRGIFWLILLERNSRIFDDIAELAEEWWEKIKFKASVWISKHSEFNNSPFQI